MTNENGEPAGSEEKRKTRTALAHFVKMLKDNGRTWPEISDFDAFTANRKKSNETTANDRRIRKFFTCLQAEKENDNMPEIEDYAQKDNEISNETTAQHDDETSTNITAPIEPDTQPAKKKPGRKRFDTVNGEKKSEKLMLYLTPELISRIRVWCDMKGVSNVGFITGLIEDFLKDKEESINTFLEFRKGL